MRKTILENLAGFFDCAADPKKELKITMLNQFLSMNPAERIIASLRQTVFFQEAMGNDLSAFPNLKRFFNLDPYSFGLAESNIHRNYATNLYEKHFVLNHEYTGQRLQIAFCSNERIRISPLETHFCAGPGYAAAMFIEGAPFYEGPASVAAARNQIMDFLCRTYKAAFSNAEERIAGPAPA
jgi:hypothetical protein